MGPRGRGSQEGLSLDYWMPDDERVPRGVVEARGDKGDALLQGPRHAEIIERLQILGHDREGLFERRNSLPQCPPFHQGKAEIVQRFEVHWLQVKRAAIRVDGFLKATFLFQRNAEVVVRIGVRRVEG